ncbi:MAG: insulinase family protein [Candidatus Delongbacteria bacterium]|jgi:zinc protease|nr:insulinase family protein [Candidatus Delongbacteria bacterium]
MKKLLSLTIILAIGSLAFAQDKINLSDDIPFDESYTVGELDNGLKYYIKHNEKPENRAEFWMVTHAGAMQEEPDQNGLAHFCEHMAFNGTKNFPDKAVLEYLQSIGMEFGPNINAWTSHNETVYTLTKVPVEDKAYIDTSMLILRDWATDVSYLDEEVEKERGVIHEEWRARNSSYSRINDSINMKLYKDSKYAKHNVIGDIDIVDSVKPKRLRDFFNTWYRPDLQAIVAIGDIDVDETEKKIREMFGSMEMPQNPKPRVEQEVPDHDETLYAIHTDKEASNVRMQVYFKNEPLDPSLTFDKYREEVVRRLAFRMLRQRIDERNQNEGQPMSYGGWGYYNIVPEKSALYCYAYPLEDEILHSAQILLEEMHRALQHGFTQEELDEVKEVRMRWAERSVREKDTRESRSHCYSVVNAFKEDDVIMSPETVLAFYKQYLDDISLEEVDQSIQGLMVDNNRVVTLSGPDNVELPVKEALADVIKKAEKKAYEPYDPVKSIDDLMSETPEPGKIIKTEKIDEPECEKWTLSNGMEMYVKFADFKKDEYAFYFFSKGGKSLYDVSQRAEIAVAGGAVPESGLADYEQIQLDRYMNGKKLYNFGGINLYNENILGLSMVKYLEDNFKMYHLMFTQPRLDKKGYEKYMSGRETFYKNRLNDPNTVMRDSITAIRYDYHPWAMPLEWEDYQKVEYSKDLLALYKERYSDADDFTLFLVGNFEREELKKMVKTYLASLPSEKETESFKDIKRYYVKNAVIKTIDIPMVTPKAKVQIEYHNNMDYTYENVTMMRAVSNILDRRFTETVREDEGGTYGVGTHGYISFEPIEEYMYYITFTCDPERVEELKGVVYDEIEKLTAGDVEDHYIEEFKKAYAKKRSEDLKDNFSWVNMLSMFDENGVYPYAPAMDKLVEKATKDQIVTFAKDVFTNDVKIEVVFLPEESK